MKMPNLPKHLRNGATVKYLELKANMNGILKEEDEDLLAVLANCYYIVDLAWDEMEEDGIVLEGDKMKRKHPAHEIARDMISRISDLSKHFGLSPLSRGESFRAKKDEGDKLDEI